jgi:sorbitol/mannitol transport system permease protein
VAAIVPIYLAVRDIGMLDSIPTLIVLYTAMNLPIAVWMMRSFFLEVPGEILEAARMDGAGVRHELTEVVLPVVAPGLAATALICAIFAWNEFFFAVNLTSIRAATMPVFLVGFVSSEGLFWAKLAAAATIASVPVLIAGWVAQRQLVRGLSMGAIK